MSPMERLHRIMVAPYEEVSSKAILGGDISLSERVTWGCHGVSAWLTQANISVGQTYFSAFNIKIYIMLFRN